MSVSDMIRTISVKVNILTIMKQLHNKYANNI